jgi:hypothetical protein
LHLGQALLEGLDFGPQLPDLLLVVLDSLGQRLTEHGGGYQAQKKGEKEASREHAVLLGSTGGDR